MAKNKAEMSLHEIRCFIQRKRMGIAESTSHEETSTSQGTEVAVSFIQERFSIKECMRYVPDKNAENLVDVCCCGQRQSHHPGNNFPDEQSSNWTENDITTYQGSNAFGSIIFRDEHSGARKSSRFLRVGCRLQMPDFLDKVAGRNCEDMLKVIDPTTWDTVDNVLHFFKDDWQLFNPVPNLAVAVIGGAKQFKLDNKRVETFARGLIKVALSTHAWILSGGCNYGIMKIVGDCVREGQTMDAENDDDVDTTTRIRCIGICLWGYVKDRDNLVVKSKGMSNRRPKTAYGQRSTYSGVSIAAGQPQQPDETIPRGSLFRAYNEPVRMYTSIKSGKSEGYLNPDHSHFLFVDNGLRNHKCMHDSMLMLCLLQRLTAGDEVFIDEPLPDGIKANDYAIPSVVIVVEGGLAVIDTVFFAVHINIPVVICSHTGRAADVFAAAVEMMLDIRSALSNPDKDPPLPQPGEYNFSVIQKKITKAFFKDAAEQEASKEKIDKLTRRVFETAVKTNLITLFDLTARDDFDSAILSALLKADRTDKAKKSENDAFDQMELALTWDRADIAEEKIFPFYPEDEKGQKNLQEVMKTALLKTKLGFVALLMSRNFSLKEFLTVEVLSGLYKATVEKDKYLNRIFCQFKRGISGRIRDITKRTEKEMQKYVEKEVISEPTKQSIVDMAIYWEFVADLIPFYETPSFDDKRRLANPYRELFIWAILLNRVEMATFFWQKIDHPIISALLAALMSKSLADRADAQDSEFSDCYNAQKVEFESLATDLINKCALVDHHMAVIALERIHEDWSLTTCLQTAALADCKKFVGSAVCQDVLNQRWQRKIVSQWPFICLGIIFAPLVPLIVKFDFGDSTNKAISLKLSRLFDLYRNSSQVDDISVAAARVAEKRAEGSNTVPLMEVFRKYNRFFKAPVTKFCFTTMTSCLFLALFFYVLLFAYHDPSLGYNRTFEYLLHAWVLTLLFEAVHEIFRFPVHSFKRKTSFWWRTVWNKAEASAIFFYAIAFILRLIAMSGQDEDINFAGKIFFAFSLFIFCTKLLRVLNASTTLGPQLVMIGNMLKELVPFLILLFIFLLAFGIAHAAFYYVESLSVVYDNFKFILTYSFWAFISGPDLSEIDDAFVREGSRDDAAYCQADNSTECPSSTLMDNSTDIAGNSTAIDDNVTTSLIVSTTPMITTQLAILLVNNSSVNESLAVGNKSAVMTFPTSPDDENLTSMSGSWFLSAFLAFWTLLSFLLVNLLIAIFSNVYNEVNQNANEIWKYYQYQMITEFESKQALPPPLSFLGLNWRLLKRLVRILYARCRRCDGSQQADNRKATFITITPPPEDSSNSSLIGGKNQRVNDSDQDPALHFEHETRSAMIRDKNRQEKHGGVINQLADIHKQLATIRNQVSRLGRLETIAEAAVVEADIAESGKKGENKPPDDNSKTPILSAKKARPRAVPSPSFNPPQSDQIFTLEKRVDNLTERIDKIQQLGSELVAAIKACQQKLQSTPSMTPPNVEKKEEIIPKLVGFADESSNAASPAPSGDAGAIVTKLPPTAPSLSSRQDVVRLSQRSSSSPPTPFVLAEPPSQLVLPVAGIGLATVPMPYFPQMHGLNYYSKDGYNNNRSNSPSQQVIIDWPVYNNQITRRQISPRK